jgi:hypothetical protein
MKFKVGDKVKVTTENACVVGRVIAVDPDDDEFPYEVEFPDGLYITEIFAEGNLEHA